MSQSLKSSMWQDSEIEFALKLYNISDYNIRGTGLCNQITKLDRIRVLESIIYIEKGDVVPVFCDNEVYHIQFRNSSRATKLYLTNTQWAAFINGKGRYVYNINTITRLTEHMAFDEHYIYNTIHNVIQKRRCKNYVKHYYIQQLFGVDDIWWYYRRILVKLFWIY